MGEPLQPSSLRPFICVGMAYFLIAVVVPIAWLKSRGEKGKWTLPGLVWSLAAGAAGAIGALGITLAFKSRGNPVYVMPLVFGLAPVVNTFVTMLMTRTIKEAGPVFFAGVIVVALGGAGVMFFKPVAKNVSVEHESSDESKIAVTLMQTASDKKERWPAEGYISVEKLRELDSGKPYKLYLKKQPLTANQKLMVFLSIAVTALCWGSYGPVLHKGQLKMAGSRLRPLLCVGLAYFGIAVVIPFILLNGGMDEAGAWNFGGVTWSLIAGAAGAIGALGIIMAFNFGGKPIFVMPLVFGVAPVVNTFITVTSEGTGSQLSVPFFVSLLLVIAGAVTVLLFAPKGHKPPGGKGKSDEKSQRDKAKSAEPQDDDAQQRELVAEKPANEGANADDAKKPAEDTTTPKGAPTES